MNWTAKTLEQKQYKKYKDVHVMWVLGPIGPCPLSELSLPFHVFTGTLKTVGSAMERTTVAVFDCSKSPVQSVLNVIDLKSYAFKTFA